MALKLNSLVRDKSVVGDKMYFTKESVEEMNRSLQEVVGKYHDLMEKFVIREYRSTQAEEHAKQGFCRRLRVMVRCIDNVFELLPPEFDGIPNAEDLIDVTINIHSFVHSISGCGDNLAWIWVHEKSVHQKDGSALEVHMVGLRSKQVRESYPNSLRDFLDSRKEWLNYLKNFRDSLSHRIPLYIPPHMVDPRNAVEYNKLETDSLIALRRGEVTAHERLESEQKKLAFFRPWMTHSLVDEAPFVQFHPQMLVDFMTIHEIAEKFLIEME